jgi:ATP-binding protein involved in chromosome partitioning
MAHEALLDLLGDTAWGDLDTLVLDLPPGTGDIVLTTLQDIPVDGVVLVSTPYPTALDDTDRSATLFREKAVPILGAVVNMAGFTCPSCGDEHALFGDDATAETDVPVLAELPFDESMQDPTEDLPSGVDGLVASVSERADEVGFDLPENPLNVAGVPAGVRVELVTEELAALDAGDELTVVTDQEPTALLAAVGAEPDGHGECGCGHGNGEERSGSSAVADVEVHQVGREEWAIRVEKGEAASADECVAD